MRAKNIKEKRRTDGICALCHQFSQLQNSHILPKFWYRQILLQSGSNYLMQFDGERPFKNSRQMIEPLLCSRCESQLSRTESIFRQNALYNGNHLPILKKLKGSHLLYLNPPEACSSDLPKDLADDLAHFALGVLWRAYVSIKHPFPDIQLDLYEKPIRTYLLERSDFPENIYIDIILCPSTPRPQTNLMMIKPGRLYENSSYHLYMLGNLGIYYYIHIGAKVAEDIRRSSYPKTSHVVVHPTHNLKRLLEFKRVINSR